MNNSKTQDRPQTEPEMKPWMARVFAAAGVEIPVSGTEHNRALWLGVEMERFLKYARGLPPGTELQQALTGYGQVLKERQPPLEDWRMDQARRALRIFTQGTFAWQVVPDQRGTDGEARSRVKFRIGSAPEAPEAPEAPNEDSAQSTVNDAQDPAEEQSGGTPGSDDGGGDSKPRTKRRAKGTKPSGKAREAVTHRAVSGKPRQRVRYMRLGTDDEDVANRVAATRVREPASEATYRSANRSWNVAGRSGTPSRDGGKGPLLLTPPLERDTEGRPGATTTEPSIGRRVEEVDGGGGRVPGWESVGRSMERRMKLRGYAGRTIEIYGSCGERYWRWSAARGRDPWASASAEEYLDWLQRDGSVSASVHDQALRALTVLLREVGGVSVTELEALPLQAKRHRPGILQRSEIEAIIHATTPGPIRLAMRMLHETGMRVEEILLLRIRDVDLERGSLRIPQRCSPSGSMEVSVPVELEGELSLHMEERFRVWEGDRQRGLAPVALPDDVEPGNAEGQLGCKWAWQWLFTSPALERLADGEGFRRRPLCEATLRRGFRRAAELVGIGKRAGLHTLRHSIATEWVAQGERLETVRSRLGLRSVEALRDYIRLASERPPTEKGGPVLVTSDR